MINIDNSSVVIDRMRAKNPQMEWVVMDALEMTLPDETFHAVIDKSLIDTILCYPQR
jgi:ubiquinone/menaquinone biosynthesis C-methylase UbiE